MLDGEETVEIACGELHRRKRDSMGQSDYSMFDGEETMEIACGELRWEGAREEAVQIACKRRASPGGSETAWDRAITACWTDWKLWK